MKLEEVIRGIKQTKLLYLLDSYAKNFEALVLRAFLEGKNFIYVTLDETAFHPKGGGQPADVGLIYSASFKIMVKKVMIVDGVVVHWGKILEGKIAEEEIKGVINWDSRYLYMKRHTAGHLFDHCLTVLKGKPVETIDSWLGDPCYVSYKGECPPFDVSKDAETLENQMISKGGKINIEIIPFEELIKKAPNAPNIYRLPHLNYYRIVTIEGCGSIPCAGTHLKDINEIGCFKINKIEKLDSSFRVYYEIK